MLSGGETKLLVREILVKIKGNEELFNDFIRLLERNKNKRDILLLVLKRILIDESMKIYS